MKEGLFAALAKAAAIEKNRREKRAENEGKVNAEPADPSMHLELKRPPAVEPADPSMHLELKRPPGVDPANPTAHLQMDLPAAIPNGNRRSVLAWSGSVLAWDSPLNLAYRTQGQDSQKSQRAPCYACVIS